MLNILHVTPYVDCVTTMEVARHDAEVERCEEEMFAYGQIYIAKANEKFYLILDYQNFSDLFQCQDLKNGADYFRNYENGNYICRIYGANNSVDIELKEYKRNALVPLLTKLLDNCSNCSTVSEINTLLMKEWLS